MLSSEKRAFQASVKPIVEFFKLDAADSSGGAYQEIFKEKSEDGESHKYYAGLREQLKNNNGVYIFYDSRGRAIYAGKAVKQKLWNELKSAFNRERGEVQSIKRVKHPSKNYSFKSSDEKNRPIRNRPVPIHALAAYVSAYVVPIPLIPKIEALLVRGFANDLLNVRMESMIPRKSKKKKTAAKAK